MPADRLTLYYSGTDPTGNRRGNAQAASVGCNSQYNCDLVRNEGCQFGLAPGRTGKGFRAGDLYVQQFRPEEEVSTAVFARTANRVVPYPSLQWRRNLRATPSNVKADLADYCVWGCDRVSQHPLRRRLYAHVRRRRLDAGRARHGTVGPTPSLA